jgi:D-citramalate synthase
MRNSPEYVFQYLDFLTQYNEKNSITRYVRVLIPAHTYKYIAAIRARYPDIHFDFSCS